MQITTDKPSHLIYRKSFTLSDILMCIAWLFVWIVICPLKSNAQKELQYDEISIYLNIQRYGGADFTAAIVDETAYLPLVDIFNFLKIKIDPSAQLDSVTGFFINPKALYTIDFLHHRIRYQGKNYQLKKEDMVKSETNLYLKSGWFGEIFGLDCTFSFRSLSVTLATKLELPVIREMRLEQMRSNISHLKGEIKTDTTIRRKYPVFHLGMADWELPMAHPDDSRIEKERG